MVSSMCPGPDNQACSEFQQCMSCKAPSAVQTTCQTWHPALYIELLLAALHDGLQEEPPLHCHISHTVQ